MTKEAIALIEEQIEHDEEEIVLEHVSIPTISSELKAKLESIEGLTSLALNNCQLASLANFPNLLELIRLELMGNALKGSELVHLKHLSKLESLSLSETLVESYDELTPLSVCKELMQLDLEGTPLSKLPDYREKVFKIFANLQILDNHDCDGKPFNYSEDECDLDGNSDNNDEDDEDEDEDEEDEEEIGDEEVEDEEDEDDEDEDDEDEDDEDEEDTKKNSKKVKK